MKRRSASLVVYILYTLLGISMFLYNLIAAEKHNQQGGGWEGVGIALLLVFGVIIAAVGLLGVIIKLIHLASGWGFFGFLAILLDIGIILTVISVALPGGNNLEAAEITDFLPIIPFIAASLTSLVSNIRSLR